MILTRANVVDERTVLFDSYAPVGVELRERPLHVEPLRSALQRRRRAIVAPLVIAGASDGTAADGIPNDVADQLEQMRFALDEDPFEASLKQMPHARMTPVEVLCPRFVELLHAP